MKKERKKRGIAGVKEQHAPYGSGVSDAEIVRIIEERLPSLLEKKPELRVKIRLILAEYVTREEFFIALREFKGELLEERKRSDERFEAMQRESERRFQAMQEESEKRFAEMREESERRFQEMREESEKRFEKMQEESEKRFKEMREESEKRFKAMQEESEKRFAEMREESERRFQEMREESEKRFEKMREESEKRFKAMREESEQRFEAMMAAWDRKFEEGRQESERRYAEMKAESDRKFEEVRAEIRKVAEELKEELERKVAELRKEFQNAVASVGTRWGEAAERAFREGMREILNRYFHAEVQEFFLEDQKGRVKGYPARYQIDLLITDSVHILVEVKSQADDFDVYRLRTLGAIYKELYGVEPRLILVAAYVRQEALKERERSPEVEIITSPGEFQP